MKTALLVLALLAFVTCCILYARQSDLALLRAVHTHRPVREQTALVFLTNSTAYISFALVLVPLIPTLAKALRQRQATTVKSCHEKRNAVTNKTPAAEIPGQRNAAVIESATLLAALLVITGIVQSLKYLVARPRPYETYPFIQKLSDAGGGSFPSGHTADAFTVMAFFTLGRYPQIGVYLLLLWALAVAYSRMALGVHYGSDVCGAAYLGILCAWSTRAIAAQIHRHRPVNPHPLT